MKIIKTERKHWINGKVFFNGGKYKTYAISLLNYGLIIDNKLKISIYKLI